MSQKSKYKYRDHLTILLKKKKKKVLYIWRALKCVPAVVSLLFRSLCIQKRKFIFYFLHKFSWVSHGRSHGNVSSNLPFICFDSTSHKLGTKIPFCVTKNVPLLTAQKKLSNLSQQNWGNKYFSHQNWCKIRGRPTIQLAVALFTIVDCLHPWIFFLKIFSILSILNKKVLTILKLFILMCFFTFVDFLNPWILSIL